MQSVGTISLIHYRRAGELADHIRARCRAGEWDNLSIDVLCKLFASSETVLTRAFKQRFAITIHSFIVNEKMAYAKSLLVNANQSVKDTAQMCGYLKVSNFSRDFARHTGVSPMAYRNICSLSLSFMV